MSEYGWIADLFSCSSLFSTSESLILFETVSVFSSFCVDVAERLLLFVTFGGLRLGGDWSKVIDVCMGNFVREKWVGAFGSVMKLFLRFLRFFYLFLSFIE